MQYLYVKNWRKFQHYKHRNPPWIKLHREIFTSQDWVMLDDASKLLAVVCMVEAGKLDGMVPSEPAYLQRIAYLQKLPNLKPLIECGFLTEALADASESKQLRTNADPEYRAQSPEFKESKKEKKDDDDARGKGGKKDSKPRHLQKTRDGSRLWCDKGTTEWEAYAGDYRKAHSGIDPELQWNDAGSWFHLLGETTISTNGHFRGLTPPATLLG